MSTKSHYTSTSQRFCFVFGFQGGREVFLGRVVDDVQGETITLEGKPISCTALGYFAIRPFTTQWTIPYAANQLQIQTITNTEAIQEATNLLHLSTTAIQRTTHPLTFRWCESAFASLLTGTTTTWNGTPHASLAGQVSNGVLYPMPNRTLGQGAQNPFSQFFEGFYHSAEQFRRALFQTPQITNTRELDKLIELEGDLTIEVGKVTNQIAVKFNQLVARTQELAQYFDSIHGFSVPITHTTAIGGWCYLITRMQTAKNWGRRTGKTTLVRDINALVKDGITSLNEVILEHCSALDMLITETFGQYGISFEIYGDMTPFASYTSTYGSHGESYGYTPAPAFAGAGV